MTKKTKKPSTILPIGIRNTLEDLTNRFSRILDHLVLFTMEWGGPLLEKESRRIFTTQKYAESEFKKLVKELRLILKEKDPEKGITKYKAVTSDNMLLIRYTIGYSKKNKLDEKENLAYAILTTIMVEDGGEF